MQPPATPMYKTSEFKFRMREKNKEIEKAFAEMGRSITLLEELNEEHHLLSQKREEIIMAIRKGLEYKQQAIDTFLKEEKDAAKREEYQKDAERIRSETNRLDQTKDVAKRQTQVNEQKYTDQNNEQAYMDLKSTDKEESEQRDLKNHLNASKVDYLHAKKFLEDCDIVGKNLEFTYMGIITFLPIIPLLFIQIA